MNLIVIFILKTRLAVGKTNVHPLYNHTSMIVTVTEIKYSWMKDWDFMVG